MSQNFEDLNAHTIYTQVKTRSEALKIRDDIKEECSGKNVVIFFEKRYHLYLKPGQDPYQLRKEIESYMANSSKAKKSAIETSSEPITPKTETTSPESKAKKEL